jgi:hypothetical protein
MTMKEVLKVGELLWLRLFGEWGDVKNTVVVENAVWKVVRCEMYCSS